MEIKENGNVIERERKIGTIHPEWGFVRVPNGYTLVSEKLNGDIKVREKGFRFVWPWEANRTFVSMTATPMDYKKEEYTSSEGYMVMVDTAVTYRVVDAEKQYIEENAFQQLNLTMSSILRRLISKYDYKKLAEIKVILEGDGCIPDFEWIKPELQIFEEKYGVRVETITIQKAELNNDLKKSQEENTLNEEKNNRNIKTAEAEKRIAELNAEATKIKGTVEVELSALRIKQLIEQIGTDTPEKLKLLRDVLIGENTNYTIIENSSNDPMYSAATKLASVNNALTMNSDANMNHESKKSRQKTKA